MKLGIIGLGVGTLAAYGREGDEIVFYEIDPGVVRLASSPSYFSFLADSRAEVKIVLGDGRLALESELKDGIPRGYDTLIVDALRATRFPCTS